MENKLRKLLDRIYEMEGLVHLSLKRTELKEDFLRLIAAKGAEVAQMCDILYKEEAPIVSLSDGQENEMEPIDKAIEITNKDQTQRNFDVPERKFISDLLPYELEEYSLEKDEDRDEVQNIKGKEENLLSENEGNAIQDDTQSRGKLVFSINDKFRFRRALFENSDVEFNNTLVLVASMENYDEAEDYFLNEKNWESGDEDVKDFLDIIKRYFR